SPPPRPPPRGRAPPVERCRRTRGVGSGRGHRDEDLPGGAGPARGGPRSTERHTPPPSPRRCPRRRSPRGARAGVAAFPGGGLPLGAGAPGRVAVGVGAVAVPGVERRPVGARPRVV